MSLSIELPPPLDEELAIEAEREGVSVSDQAALLLHLMTALTREGRKTPFRSVVKAYLNRYSLDADRLADVFEGLMEYCLHDPVPSSVSANPAFTSSVDQIDSEKVRSLLRGWRDPAAHCSLDHDVDVSLSELPPLDHLIQRAGRMRRTSVMGKYSWLKGSSEDYAIEKQLEIAREDRHR